MHEKPTTQDLIKAKKVLTEFSELEVTKIQTLRDLIHLVPAVGLGLFTILREGGHVEPKPELPFDAPSKPLIYGPISSMYRELEKNSLELTGSRSAVLVKKWDHKKRPLAHFDDLYSLASLVPNVEILVPTLTHPALYAVIRRGRVEQIMPVNQPTTPEVQQQYARFLQELVLDVLLVMAREP